MEQTGIRELSSPEQVPDIEMSNTEMSNSEGEESGGKHRDSYSSNSRQLDLQKHAKKIMNRSQVDHGTRHFSK